jgi:hypothetical protein
MPNPYEHEEQKRVVEWCRWVRNKYPAAERIFAIPNGGWRHKATAGKLKAEGARPGIPDLFLPVPKGSCHGLWIEMKRRGGRISENQKAEIELLQADGYRVEVCYGADQAIKVLEDYFS